MTVAKSGKPEVPAPPPHEARGDAAPNDAQPDAPANDAQPDAPNDAQPDAPNDAQPDAPNDAQPDAPNDAQPDAPANDAQPDAPANDAQPNTSTSKPTGVSQTWGSAARVITLFSALGAAVVFWAQLTFRSAWVPQYLIANTLKTDARSRLLVSLLVGAGVGAAVSIGLLIRARLRHRAETGMERIAWFLSPLILLPFFPLLFRYRAWIRYPMALLVSTGVFALCVEGSVLKSLRACPELLVERVRRWRARLPKFVRVHAATLTVLAGALFYTLFMSYWTIIRHYKLQSAVYDLGISDNLTYNALRGHFMVTPLFSGAGAHPGSFLSAHAQLGTYLWLPIYAFFPRAETLLVIQSALLGLTAIPLYFFARRRVSAWTSALIALAYLAYYPMHGANFHDMTYIPVASFFVVATVWAVDRGSWIWFVPALLAALSMREDIPIGLAVAGLVFLLAGRRPAMAVTLTVTSVLYFVGVRFWLMPHEGTWQFPSMLYSGLIPKGAPHTFKEVAATIITNPLFAFRKILTESKLRFVLDLMVPLAFLPLRRAWLLAACIPGVLLTLLTTNYGPTVEIGFHYVMHWTPYLFLAVPLALAAIRDRDGSLKMRAALAAMLAATAVTTWSFGAFAEHPTFKAGFSTFNFKYTARERHRYAELSSLIKMIPCKASLAVSERIGAHAANRVNAYSMRDGAQGAEYILTGKNDLGVGCRGHLVRALAGGKYGVLARAGEFALFKKGYSTAHNAALRKDWHL